MMEAAGWGGGGAGRHFENKREAAVVADDWPDDSSTWLSRCMQGAAENDTPMNQRS